MFRHCYRMSAPDGRRGRHSGRAGGPGAGCRATAGPARSAAGCTALPPTSAWTVCAASSGGSTRWPRCRRPARTRRWSAAARDAFSSSRSATWSWPAWPTLSSRWSGGRRSASPSWPRCNGWRRASGPRCCCTTCSGSRTLRWPRCSRSARARYSLLPGPAHGGASRGHRPRTRPARGQGTARSLPAGLAAGRHHRVRPGRGRRRPPVDAAAADLVRRPGRGRRLRRGGDLRPGPAARRADAGRLVQRPARHLPPTSLDGQGLAASGLRS